MKVWQFIALMERKRRILGYLSHTDEYVIANLKMTPREMTLEDHKEVFSAIRRYIAILDHTRGLAGVLQSQERRALGLRNQRVAGLPTSSVSPHTPTPASLPLS